MAYPSSVGGTFTTGSTNPFAAYPIFGGTNTAAPAAAAPMTRTPYFDVGQQRWLTRTVPAPTTTITPPNTAPPIPPPSPSTFQDPMTLVQEINKLMTEQVKAAYESNLPQYNPMRDQQSDVINQQLKGQVPNDVVNQIIQSAAERGILTGAPGSPNTNAAYLRSLGLTSAAQQQAGVANLDTAIKQTPVPEPVNPASILIPERLGYLELLSYLNASQPRAVTSGGPGYSSTQYLQSSPNFSFYGQPYKVGG